MERVKGQPWNVFAERRGDAGRDLFLWAARRYCGMTVGERGAVAGCARAAASAAIMIFVDEDWDKDGDEDRDEG